MVRSNIIEKKLGTSTTWASEFSTVDYPIALHKTLFIRHYLNSFWSKLYVLLSKKRPRYYAFTKPVDLPNLTPYRPRYKLVNVLALNTIFIKEDFNGFCVFLKCSSFDSLIPIRLSGKALKKWRPRNLLGLKGRRLKFYKYVNPRNSFDFRVPLSSPLRKFFTLPAFFFKLNECSRDGSLIFDWETVYAFRKDRSRDSAKVGFLLSNFKTYNFHPRYTYWLTPRDQYKSAFIKGSMLRYLFYYHRNLLKNGKKELLLKLSIRHRIQKNEFYLSTTLGKNVYLYLRSDKSTLRSMRNVFPEIGPSGTYPAYLRRRFRKTHKLNNFIVGTLVAIRWKNPTALLALVRYLLPKLKNQFILVNLLKDVLPYSIRHSLNTKAVKIQLKGSFNKAKRASQVTILTSNQSFNESCITNRCEYFKGFTVARRGVFGIKIWIT